MGFNIKTRDGKTGYFDAKAFIAEQAPGAQVMDYDPKAGSIRFKAGNKEGQFSVRAMLGDQGAEITGVTDLNNPEAAADVSPLTWKERFELGFLTRESSDFQRLVGGVNQLFGGKGGQASDASIKANEQRALKILKARYGDASISNGEMVVKHNGVWKKVDSSSDSIGEDAAQLLGSAGLNLMGAVAGGTIGAQTGAAAGVALGPVGIAAGGIIGAAVGAIAGSVAGEVMEEATAVGIAGGEVDPQGAARDLMTESLMAMVGESVGAVGSKIASRMVGKEAANAARALEIQKEATVVRGFKKIGEEADGKVKDMIAETYSSINPELSAAPLREAIDSADNMAKVHSFSRVARNIQPGQPNPLLRSMADTLQESVEGSMSKAEEKFGKVLEVVRNNVSDDFSIDLGQRVKDLRAAAESAPRDKRAFFNVIENETADLAARLEKGGQEARLTGRKALALVERQRTIITQKLKDTGAFDPQAVPGSDDRLLHKAMSTIKGYLDSELLDAAERTQMSKPFAAVKDMYRSTKEAVEVVWSKSFSNKRDLTFAQNVAKGKVDANIIEALANLNVLHPEAKVAKALSDMRLKQAGIEMTPIFKVPDLIRAAGATGAAMTGGPLGVAAAATVASPRFAAKQAGMAARGSEMLTKNALVQAMPAARAKARSLMGLAYTGGFIRTLNQSAARSLLTNPDAFLELVQSSSALSKDMATMDETLATDMAIKLQQQKAAK